MRCSDRLRLPLRRWAGAVWLAAVLSVALVPGAAAQPADPPPGDFGRVEDRQSNAGAYYFYVLPGELTKQVYVWGTVRLPGVYVVGVTASLGEVLSLAGGPALAPLQDRTRREVTIRVYRTSGGTRSLVYEAPLDQMVLEPEQHPLLTAEDVVEVETRDIRPPSLRDALPFVSAAASLILVFERIFF